MSPKKCGLKIKMSKTSLVGGAIGLWSAPLSILSFEGHVFGSTHTFLN